MGGNVKGEWVEGEASQVEDKDSARVRELFRKKYGMQMKLFNAFSWVPGIRRDDSLLLRIRFSNSDPLSESRLTG